MLSGVGDLGGEGVDEIQRIGRGAHTQASSFDLLDDVEGHGPAGQVAREAYARPPAVHRESRVDPAEQGVKELLREPRVEVRQLQEPSACTRRWKLAA